jgi:hypothetical protein
MQATVRILESGMLVMPLAMLLGHITGGWSSVGGR